MPTFEPSWGFVIVTVGTLVFSIGGMLVANLMIPPVDLNDRR